MPTNSLGGPVECPALAYADVVALIELLGAVGDPTTEVDVLARRHSLATGLLHIVGGDTFYWTVGFANPNVSGDAMPTSYVDGGWKDAAERDAFFHLMVHSEAAKAASGDLTEHVKAGKPLTIVRPQVVPDEAWAVVGKEFYDQGFGEYLLSLYPLGEGGFSCLGVHRRVGKPPFGQRERILVHLALKSVDWIHRHAFVASPAEHSIRLSPREREVHLLLLRGESQKSIAHKLALSQHTVGDYVKRIYEHFQVKSRGELLARYIAGNPLLD